jgi:NADH:ubiquinone oxidoreductase subunit E
MESNISELLSNFKLEKGSLISLLQQVQAKLGYLSQEAISEVSQFTGLSESYIFGVASFYSQFYFTRRGRHTIKVCLGTACHVRGGQGILDEISRHLGAESGATTQDDRFSLERVACFGSCALAPVMVVDSDVYGRMTAAKAKQILENYK